MLPIAPWYAVQGREADVFRGPATRSVVLDEAYEQARQRAATSGAGSAGTEVLTAAEVRVVQYLPTHLSFPEIARELSVSPHTVKGQAMSAYRKLGAHTRGEAIRRARGKAAPDALTGAPAPRRPSRARSAR